MARALGAVLLVWSASACRPAAPSGFTLLFFDRYPAASVGGLSWAPDPERSRLVGFDRELRVARVVAIPELARPVAVAGLDGGGRLLVTEQTGEGIVLDTAGRVVREWESPHPVALHAAWGDRIVAARSPYRVPQFIAETDTAPLFRVLDTLGRPVAGVGAVRVPALPFLTQVVNAGAVATDSSGAVYFAPLARDEIRKYDAAGTLLWTTRRGLYAEESDPVGLRHAIAGVALTLARSPEVRLYALGARDSGATRLRVDVLDPRTGRILETRPLDSTETAVALGPRGRLETFAAVRLLAGVSAVPRERFAPPFALPNLAGDTITLARSAGKVTLVNFWASWCDPCREEFPHMAELYRDFGRADFEIVAISDDVDGGKMRAFLREFRPPFPILVGGGRMKQAYRYRGLPYSVLLDRGGRIIARIFGFGGPAEFARLRETIANEIRAP